MVTEAIELATKAACTSAGSIPASARAAATAWPASWLSDRSLNRPNGVRPTPTMAAVLTGPSRFAYRSAKASTPVGKWPRLIVSQCSAPSSGRAALSGSSPAPKMACLAQVTPIRPALPATSRANSSACGPACPAGHSRSTSPICAPRAGLIGLAVKMNSSARLGPSRRARYCAPPPPDGRQPNRSISGTPSRSPSLSAQNRRSQAAASSRPPARVCPSSAAMTRNGAWRRRKATARKRSMVALKSASRPGTPMRSTVWAIQVASAPAENTFRLLSSTTAATRGSCSASSSAASNASSISALIALTGASCMVQRRTDS